MQKGITSYDGGICEACRRRGGMSLKLSRYRNSECVCLLKTTAQKLRRFVSKN